MKDLTSVDIEIEGVKPDSTTCSCKVEGSSVAGNHIFDKQREFKA